MEGLFVEEVETDIYISSWNPERSYNNPVTFDIFLYLSRFCAESIPQGKRERFLNCRCAVRASVYSQGYIDEEPPSRSPEAQIIFLRLRVWGGGGHN